MPKILNNEDWLAFFTGLAILIAGFKPIKHHGFEYVICALLPGILVRSIFGYILSAGSLGLTQAVIAVLAVRHGHS
jgi:hypothetical protein